MPDVQNFPFFNSFVISYYSVISKKIRIFSSTIEFGRSVGVKADDPGKDESRRVRVHRNLDFGHDPA